MALKRTPIKRGTKQMKRSGFKRKTYQEAISAQKAKKKPSQSRTKAQKSNKKTKSKGYKTPKWFNTIPYGTHGSKSDQKRLWKLTSDYVRIHNFHTYWQSCASCSHIFTEWQSAQCGHFKKYSVCNSYFKFNLKNLAAQCPMCNHRDDGVVGHAYGEELKRRHGDDIIEWIEKENAKYHGKKLETIKIVEMAREAVDLMDKLPEQPPYWPALKHKLAEHEKEMI